MAKVPTIAVIDYHKGNLSSVARGLARAGAEAVITDEPDAIRAADGAVIPGVGSFFDAITFMHESGQDAAVLDAVAAGKPLLGICLGLQLLFERGDEGVPDDAPAQAVDDLMGTGLAPATVFAASDGGRWVRGLGVLYGSCTVLPSRRLKVPHVGWDALYVTEEGRACPLLENVAEGANVYFTHSFAVDDDAEPADIAALTHYGRSFASVVAHGCVYGCQFHPEKSSAHGLEILKNFVRIVACSQARGEGE